MYDIPQITFTENKVRMRVKIQIYTKRLLTLLDQELLLKI